MSTITSNAGVVPAGEPKPIIPPLASFYLHARDLGWLVVRLTAGGMLLVHGIMKMTPMADRGFAAVIEAFATGSLARRGIEPALILAYVVFFIETIGAVMIILGLFTRFIAAAAAIEFAIITFLAHWPAGFAWSRGGWEYPLFWGLILFAIALVAAALIRSTASSGGSCSRRTPILGRYSAAPGFCAGSICFERRHSAPTIRTKIAPRSAANSTT
jgi:putative oxidoreductase